VLALALLGQLGGFASERAFHRFVDAEWRHLFPRLPSRVQLNAAVRGQAGALVAFGRACARRLDALTAEYEVLDCTAVPLRTAKRRGVGAMPEVAARGTSGRLGWFVGVRLLVAATPAGAITGWGIAPGNEQDRSLADALLAERAAPEPALPGVGRPASGVYLADSGFAGREARARWGGAGRRRPGAAPARQRRPLAEAGPVPAPPQAPDRRDGLRAAARGVPPGARPSPLLGRAAGPHRRQVALSNALIRLNRDAGRPGLTLAGGRHVAPCPCLPSVKGPGLNPISPLNGAEHDTSSTHPVSAAFSRLIRFSPGL
jgi:hypothetical protein